jgi:phospholipid/cholesterol/gamma-HCH transport system substrate-binding protein
VKLSMKKIVTALVAVVVVLGALAVVKGRGNETKTYTAYFADSAGLFVGNDVGVLGVKVGKVTSIVPDGNQVKVTLQVDGDRPVPANAGAVIVARSVATDRYVELTPAYSSGATMHDGATIPLRRTRTPVEFDEVLADLSTFANDISGSKEASDAVKRIVDAGSEALAGQGQPLHDMIGSLSAATGDVAGQREQFAATLTSLDTLVNQVADNEQTERAFIKQVADASSLLANQRQEFKDTLNSLESAVTQLAQFSAANKGAIVGTLNDSSSLIKKVNTKQAAVAEILRDLPLALQNLQRADAGGTLPARLDPVVLTPISGLLQQLCKGGLVGAVCNLIDGTDLTGNLGELLGLLTGGTK